MRLDKIQSSRFLPSLLFRTLFYCMYCTLSVQRGESRRSPFLSAIRGGCGFLCPKLVSGFLVHLAELVKGVENVTDRGDKINLIFDKFLYWVMLVVKSNAIICKSTNFILLHMVLWFDQHDNCLAIRVCDVVTRNLLYISKKGGGSRWRGDKKKVIRKKKNRGRNGERGRMDGLEKPKRILVNFLVREWLGRKKKKSSKKK